MAIEREVVVAARLAVLDENLRILEPFAGLDLETYLGDPRNYGTAERFLQLSIEAVFDIGAHCISALKLPKPLTYGDILPTLAQAGLISAETQAESQKGCLTDRQSGSATAGRAAWRSARIALQISRV